LDPLSGGIMQEGYQCGMLWGVSLAVGAEAYKTCAHTSQAIIVAIEASKLLMESFIAKEHTSQCIEITDCNFKNNLSFAKYMISGRFLHCFQLAEDWAPQAVKKARESLALKPHNFNFSMSCATEVAKKMGASDKEAIMVAGFAGGLGLSGSGCGALSAAIWMHALSWCRDHKKGSAMKNARAGELLSSFLVQHEGQFTCEEICSKQFSGVDEHTNYLMKGGCHQLISDLSSF
ncbi:C-GCAxxG-C-C family (seleno)protein, partial [Lutimonas sp.]|uniref:C-GCAxxG-C-C family (seleno)protein n=1 Tax=Lutimonas sp. TaxID=1872403 RepID=UPI003D9AFA89